MDRQRVVQQQNSATRAKIAECARRFTSGDPALTWLTAVLKARAINPARGILAAYTEESDQRGRLCSGSWLTGSGDFWDFQILFPATGGLGPIVKSFDERSVSVFAHERGIAKSFGKLAIEVRDEIIGR